MKTKCGHNYCSDCIQQLLSGSRGPVPCPLCLAPITKRSLDSDKKVSKFVTSVRGIITNIKLDCGLEGKFSVNTETSDFF